MTDVTLTIPEVFVILIRGFDINQISFSLMRIVSNVKP